MSFIFQSTPFVSWVLSKDLFENDPGHATKGLTFARLLNKTSNVVGYLCFARRGIAT